MKFRLRTSVELSKEFEIEAEHLNDATKMVEKLEILAKQCGTQRL